MPVLCRRIISTFGDGMSDAPQSGSRAALLEDGCQPASPGRSPRLAKAAYSVCSGAAATVFGAAASLVVPAADRVAVWCAVSGVTAVGAGLMWHSGSVSACREALTRWITAVFSS